MTLFSRRKYLFAAGSALTALAVATPAAAQTDSDNGLDYERTDSDDIQFDYEGLTLETDGDSVELQDDYVDFERDDDNIELAVDNGVRVDFEAENGDTFELSVTDGGDVIDIEGDDGDVEVTIDGNVDRFEAEDGNQVEFATDNVSLEVNEDEVELSGSITLEYDGEEFEYADDDISLEFDDEKLEYASPDLTLEWDEDGRDFEVRRR